jgi:hypothetical protein
MRYMNDSLNWRGSGHFITDAAGVRVCKGDSGGPYFFDGTEIMFGLLSEAEESSECAKVGGKVAGTRLTADHADKINEFREAEGLEACRRLGNPATDYWVCE